MADVAYHAKDDAERQRGHRAFCALHASVIWQSAPRCICAPIQPC